MDPLESTCRAIQARDGHARSLEKAEKFIRALPWYRFVEHNRRRDEVASLRSLIADCEAQIGSDGLLALANKAGSLLWHEAAGKVIPNKNPYGPASEQHFEEIFRLVLKNREDYDLRVGGRTFRLATLSDVLAKLDESFIRSNVRAMIAERAAIAASTDFLHKRFTDFEGNPAVLVQHVASGLRAKFVITQPGFGSVNSKPYAIQSIDPNRPGESSDWMEYVGLGIGVKLYQEGHRLMPGVRWMSSAYSAYSPPLRKKLHASDPYTWSGSCTWCDQKLKALGIYSWQDTNQQFFTNHP